MNPTIHKILHPHSARVPLHHAPKPQILTPMLGSLKKALTAVKEGAVEAGAKSYLNTKIQDFGTVTDLQIDTSRRMIRIEAELKGESSPIQVTIGNYDVSTSGDTSFVIARDFEASREWLATVLNQYVAGRPFRIPNGVRNLL